MSALARVAALALLALLPLLAGCGPAEVEEEIGRGAISPANAVASFIEDLNLALADPSLSEAATRNRWAEQLASRFAPSERLDQRQAMREMLAGFAASAARPVVGERVLLTISFSDLEVVTISEDEALVRLVDGVMVLRWLNGDGEVLRERTGGLMEIVGGGAEGLPVLRVDRQWFMTEG